MEQFDKMKNNLTYSVIIAHGKGLIFFVIFYKREINFVNFFKVSGRSI